MGKTFVHLHNHTDYSLLDGMTHIKDAVSKVKSDGQTALAITDHGSCYGLPNFYNECKKQGIKPILGCEVYEAPVSRFDKSWKERKKAKKGESEEEKESISLTGNVYYHTILLVKNAKGYENLCHLVTKSNTEGFYHKPRIDRELLEQYHDGLICLSACLAGRIAQDILRNPDKTREDILWYKNLFGEDFYLEIQNHGIPEEMCVSEELVRYSDELGIKLVCTNDCHYLNSDDGEAHDWLMCMQTGKTINDASRMTYTGDYSVKTEEEMRKLFPSLPEAFDNTVEIADKCNFEFVFGQYRMPKVIIPDEWNGDYFGYLESEAWKGYEKRYPKNNEYRDRAKERLAYELSIIKDMGFAEYFLDTRKTIMWAKSHDILVGVGRGSGAGSVMNYCLEITDVNPLRYDLLFERFLNPERVSMPDIDVDYDYAYKDDVVRFEAESNGLDKFCKIQTIQSMFAKSIVRGCAKVAGFDTIVGTSLAKMIPENAKNLEDAYGLNPSIEAYLKTDDRIRKIWDICLKLEGCKKSGGTHACGHIPTPVPCEELFPCRVDDETGYLVCQYDMSEAEHLGNLKKDLLMLRNLTIIDVARKGIKAHYGIDVPLWNETVLYDMDALKLFWTGDTLGIFQFESAGITKFMSELKPDTFEDIVAGVALYRPGPMDYIPDYISGKKNPKTIHYLCKELEPILKNTYGVIVYQEQVMQICTDLAGFTMGHADIVRKAMGKKKKDIMDAEKPNFLRGCKDNGIAEEVAIEIWSRMEKFAEYAFNKSHAVCYACISMETAYLKAHYPIEFMAGLLSSVMDDTDKLVPYLHECKNMGIRVAHPDINTSLSMFKAEKDYIVYGLASIKGISRGVIDEISTDRNTKGTFTSFADFRRRIKVKKNVLENLIKAGAMDSFGNRHSMLEEAKKEIKKSKQVEGQISLFDNDHTDDKTYLDDLTEYNRMALLGMEKEATGLYLSGHPVDNVKRYLNETEIIRINEEDTGFEEGLNISVIGILTEVTKRYTKKDNKAMASIIIEDETSQIRGVIFPKQFDKNEWITELDGSDLVLVKGRLGADGNGFQIIVDTIDTLSEKEIADRSLVRHYIIAKTEEQVRKVSDVLYCGNTPTMLIFNGKVKDKCSDIEEHYDEIIKIVGQENLIIR